MNGESQAIARPWRERLGMGFGEFWAYRSGVHATTLLGLGFVAAWAAVGATMGEMHWALAVFFSFMVTCVGLLVYAASCLLVVPLLPLVLISLPTVAMEAWWRVRMNRPYVPPPPGTVLAAPSVHVPAPAPAPPQKRSGGWLVPLVIGMWIGSTWGDD